MKFSCNHTICPKQLKTRPSVLGHLNSNIPVIGSDLKENGYVEQSAQELQLCFSKLGVGSLVNP